MAIGDAAAAAGLPLVAGTLPANQIDTELNRTRDQVAAVMTETRAITKGGTGATTAAAARTALGVTPENLGAWKNSGAVTAGQAPTLGWDGSTLLAAVPGYATAFQLARRSDLPTTDWTLSGQLYVPNSFAAVAGYTLAYINSDGRLSKGASSERYKKHITPIDPDELGNLFPQLHKFQMRALDGTADGTWRYGYIAEHLNDDPDMRRFVVYDDQGRPDSIDFIGLLLAQVAQLHERAAERDAIIDSLLERVEALEATHAGD